MTKEQNEACEKLAETEGLKFYPKVWEGCGDSGIQSEINYSRRVHYKKAFSAGFQAAQTPEMLILNPLVKGLVDGLQGFIKLMDDEVMVRNIDDDHDAVKYMKQATRITSHLSAVHSALAPFKEGE